MTRWSIANPTWKAHKQAIFQTFKKKKSLSPSPLGAPCSRPRGSSTTPSPPPLRSSWVGAPLIPTVTARVLPHGAVGSSHPSGHRSILLFQTSSLLFIPNPSDSSRPEQAAAWTRWPSTACELSASMTSPRASLHPLQLQGSRTPTTRSSVLGPQPRAGPQASLMLSSPRPGPPPPPGTVCSPVHCV